MIIKLSLIALLATSGAVVTVSNQQGPAVKNLGSRQSSQQAHRTSDADLDRLIAQIEGLQAKVEVLAGQVQEAEQRSEGDAAQIAQLEAELEYCQENHVARRRDRGNCTPSRSMLVHFKRALREQNNERLANRIARDIAATVGDNNNSLNSYTWNLLTKDRNRDQHNDLALALAERMQSRPKQLNHFMLDTIALAKFRTGYVDEAIAIQKQALKRNRGNRDYQRRLKMYLDKKARCASTADRRIN